MSSQHIIVIGAGAIGASCAWRLARAGYDVTLIDDPGSAPASEVAAGMLAPVTEAEYGEERLLELNLRSSRSYEDFVAELVEATGRDVGFRRCGTLMVARDADDKRVLDDIFRHQQRLGLDAVRMGSQEVRAKEPVLSPAVRGGISVAGDHQIDPSSLVAALHVACEGAGVSIVHERVVEIDEGTTTVDVVLTSGSRRSCDQVVVAAGSYTGSIAGAASRLPVRPVKGQLVHLRERGGTPLPGANIRGLDVYIVTRGDGRVVVGASVEEQGFDVTLTAGAVHDLLRYAYELWPGVVELEYVGVTAGLRPATPDNAPVVGKLRDRVVVATGHYRNGVLLAPVTAAGVVELVAGRSPGWLDGFGPERFASTVGSLR